VSRRPRVAVVGHVEWVTHARGDMPGTGLISYLVDPLEEVGGGGAVAACQAAKLGADTLFLTAVGDDARGARAVADLEAAGVRVRAATRPSPQTAALSAVNRGGDRAIAVVGTPVHPEAADDLGWDDLARCDAVYFTGRDPDTLDAARRARVLVVMARRWPVLARWAGVADVLVGSAGDPVEQPDPAVLLRSPPTVVMTEGGRGGAWTVQGAPAGRWEPVPPPGAVVDTYGCGDSFAAGLTVGLARGLDVAGAAALGARCGAAVATARGGLRGQPVEGGDPAP
jgi:ribokinase